MTFAHYSNFKVNEDALVYKCLTIPRVKRLISHYFLYVKFLTE